MNKIPLALLIVGSACVSGTESDSDGAADSARFRKLKRPGTSAVRTFVNEANDTAWVMGVYSFKKPDGEDTDPVKREKRVQEVMHRYMCNDAEDISARRIASDQSVARAINNINEFLSANSVELDEYGNQSTDVPQVGEAFRTKLAALALDARFDVFSAGAEGPDTDGFAIGVYDIAKHHIAYAGYLVCGDYPQD